MNHPVRIYLSGKIKKSHEIKGGYFWGNTERNDINREFSPLKVDYLDPSDRTDDLSDELSIFGRDLLQVYLSDAVFADVRERRGIGVGGEMIFAGWIGVPVISIAAENSFYRTKKIKILYQEVSEWTHPFVRGPSAHVASSVSLAARWVKEQWIEKGLSTDKLSKIKMLPTIFLHSIQHYIKNQLAHDQPMHQIISENKDLENVIGEFLSYS